MTTPLSPEAQKLQEAINDAFTQLRMGVLGYTMDEIKAALVKCGCWRVQESMQRELEAGRVRDRAA